MEMNMIEMDEEQARAAYEDYAAAVRANHSEEDRAIAEGYKALSEGKRLIHLSQTLAVGGISAVSVGSRFDRGEIIVEVPNLAFCRADAKVAWTTGIDSHGGCLITAEKRAQELHQRNTKDRFRIADGTFEPYTYERGRRGAYVRAIVPNIPPHLRPKRGLRLYTILWEAEWAADPEVPYDPALLRRLGGELYIVLGTWDLTPLERSVLAGRV